MQATTNFAAQKIEDKKEMEMNHKENKNKMESTIRMSASTKALIQTDPQLAEDLNRMIEELMSEDRAELEKKLKTETEDEEGESEDEEEEKTPEEKMLYEEMLYRSQIMDDACSNKMVEKFEEVLQELTYLHCDDSDDENVCECGVPESEECRPDCPYQARKAAEVDCPLERECLKKIKEIQKWVIARIDDKDGAAWNPLGRHLVNLHACSRRFDKKIIQRIIRTFIAWLINTKNELHKQAKTASKLTRSGGKWIADHIRVCNCGCNEVYPARFYLNIPFMIEEKGDDSQWVGFTIDFNVDQSNPKEAWFTISTKLLREIREVGEEEGKSEEAIDSLMNDLFGPKLNWLARKPHLVDISIIDKGQLETTEERKKRKEKFAQKQLKEAKRREDQAEQRRVDKEIQDRRLAERVAREEEERKVREAEFAARVAALAERERQNKQAEIAAKEERGRIAEANKKLRAEQKEAERVAKFVNKRK